MTLKVGLVARCLNTEHIRGMGKYAFELLQQCKPEHSLEWCLFGDDHRYGMVTPPGKALDVDIFSFKGDRFYFWEQLGLPLRAIKRNIDILHCTEGTLSLWQPKPTVVTVHDTLSWEERPDTAKASLYFESVLPAALKKCAAVVTISESSRSDILTRWPWLESKLTVIPHGIEDAYFKPEASEIPAELKDRLDGSPYIVYMGGPMERKRFDWALELLARADRPSLKLVACGFGAAAREAATKKLPDQLKGRVVFASFLSDVELRAVYRAAQAVLYPTLYEGFGFPAIEAQAAGVPVLFSALGSLKELIGPLAFVVPANDMDAWVAALTQAMNLGGALDERARLAANWAQQYSWSESFEKHLTVYRKAAVDFPES
jgi:glycosyltransferase involved in cell wall biosynthesis